MKTLTIILCLVASLAYSQTATVHIERKKMNLGVLGNLNVFIDGKLVCKVDNNTYTTHTLPTGKHSFTVQYSGNEAKQKANNRAIELDLKEGETYVLKAIIEKTFTKSELMLEEVTPSTWERDKKDLKPTTCE